MKENQWKFFKELILIYQFIFPFLKKKTISFLELYIKINVKGLVTELAPPHIQSA